MKKLDKLTDIPHGNYEGYLWYSNSRQAEVIESNEPKMPAFPEERSIPFIIEGMLYERSSKRSIHIKNLNGKYVITQFDFDHYPEEEIIVEDRYYLVNGQKFKMHISELWKTQPLEEGSKFEALAPIAHVFSGFTKTKQ
ncbi:TIGR04423 family type III CRISPR-associated protein [Algivirga pacifica]|uniref:Uncharacterized protein n=1 Tax=Algivirga pacifica TaxID=1162670 RepID=A0ABP9D9W7_9BACT